MSHSQGSILKTNGAGFALGLAVLWAAWGLACIALFFFVSTTFRSREQSLLALRREQAETVTQDLAQAFEGLEALPSIAVREAKTLALNGELSQERFSQLQADLAPFGHLIWLDDEGRARWDEPGRSAPRWLVNMARRRSEQSSGQLITLRPLPVGIEAGRVDSKALHLDPETPAEYLVAVARGSDGDLFVSELDLGYVYGLWLKKRLDRSVLGDSLKARTLGELEPSPPLVSPGVDAPKEIWQWGCPTFFASEPYPSAPLLLELDNRPSLRLERQWIWGGGLMAGFVMLVLGFSIALAQRAAKREMEAAQARTRFADMVGHELRTPIAAISMYAEILREGLIEDQDKIVVYHEQLRRQTERMRALVEKVLTYARLEQGQSQSTSAPVLVDVSALLADAALAVESLGHSVKIGSLAQEALLTDPEVTVQILANLLENAIKHSEGDEPVELEVQRLTSGELEFRVLDRGKGVPPEWRTVIFEPYRSLLSGSSAKQEKPALRGLGLGLTIARGLAQSLGGGLEYREREGGGSIFALILPEMRKSLE